MTSDIKGLRVLVVEDDFDVAEALRAVLVSAGCDVERVQRWRVQESLVCWRI